MRTLSVAWFHYECASLIMIDRIHIYTTLGTITTSAIVSWLVQTMFFRESHMLCKTF
ncbi:hypothetical protein SERLA73DRAFT_130458 [Serpula lacrymans var. lacrymans S7.3]|uniref:Uncharacterized protein n=1 Tax=Serpula lacrymans var. lacrymans (strain S7.3) TaxID=936435 RepID=F8PKT5_SERL3|nr:hypothetical protein SERLA73DRAFT_130458 [Serpula lacrymans var. lacrymans S7.3]